MTEKNRKKKEKSQPGISLPGRNEDAGNRKELPGDPSSPNEKKVNKKGNSNPGDQRNEPEDRKLRDT